MLEEGQVVDIMREMLLVCIKLAGPVLLLSIVVGLVVAVFQAATQIQEQTLTFVPKLLVIALALLALGSFMFTTLQNFTLYLFDLMASL